MKWVYYCDIIHCVADLNAQLNDTLINEAYEGIKHCINKLTREKGYEYFFREGINEENRNSIVREVSAKMIIFFFGLKKMSSHYFLNSYMWLTFIQAPVDKYQIAVFCECWSFSTKYIYHFSP